MVAIGHRAPGLDGFLWRLLIGTVIVAACVWMLPLIVMTVTALKPAQEIYSAQFSWLPRAPTFENFVTAWNAAPFAQYYLNSIFVALTATVITVTIASMAAFAICRLPFFGRNAVLVGTLGSKLIPFQVLLIPFFILMTTLQLANTRWGLILAYVAICLPFAVFILRAYFLEMPKEVEESARIDGCTWFGVYFRICLPMSRPALATVGIYTFIECWREFMIAVILTNNDSLRTVPVGLASFRNEMLGVSWGEMMAAALTAGLPGIVVFIVLQRQLISGLTQGAVKG